MPHDETRRVWENEVPQLPEIMQWGGQPGRAYAYVSLEGAMEASQNGYSKVIDYDEQGNPKDSGFFELVGPKGRAAFILMETGDPMRGASPFEGAREVKIDVRLYAKTGIPDPDAIPDVPNPAPRTTQQEAGARAS